MGWRVNRAEGFFGGDPNPARPPMGTKGLILKANYAYTKSR
jgi:hypothetical protein